MKVQNIEEGKTPRDYTARAMDKIIQGQSNFNNYKKSTAKKIKEKGLKVTIVNFLFEIYRFIMLGGKSMRKQFGTDAYFLLQFMKFINWFMLVGMIVCVASLLPINILLGEKNTTDFAITTISVLPINSGFRFIHAGIQYIYVIGAFILVFFFTKLITYNARFYYSQYTIKVTGLKTGRVTQRHEQKKLLLEHFQNQFGADHVNGCHIIYDLSRFERMLNYRKRLEKILAKYRKIVKVVPVRPLVRKYWWSFSQYQDAVEYYEEQIKLHDQKIRKYLNEKGVYCTGTAFVSFTGFDLAKRCCIQYHAKETREKRKFKDIDGKERLLSVQMAPERDNIFWNHLGYGVFRRLLRAFVSNLAAIIIIMALAFLFVCLSGMAIIFPLLQIVPSDYFGYTTPFSVSEFFWNATPITIALLNSRIGKIMKGK